MKETEALHAAIKKAGIYPGFSSTYSIEAIENACKLYHQERIKSILPSEQEIVNISNSWCFKTTYQYPDLKSYEQGFKDALTLLTKGR